MAEQADPALVAEANDVARRELLRRLDQRLPARAVEALDQRCLDLRLGLAADAAAPELGRDHLGVVHDKLVAGLEPSGRSATLRSRSTPSGCTTSIRAESRGLAGRSAMLLGGQFEVEEIGAHAYSRSYRSPANLLLTIGPQPIAQPDQSRDPRFGPLHQTIAWGSGGKRKRHLPALQADRREPSRSSATAGKVANRSEPARIGATAEKFGTHPAIVRSSPAAACRNIDRACQDCRRPARPDAANASRLPVPIRRTPDVPLARSSAIPTSPTASPVTPGGQRIRAGTMAISIRPSATIQQQGIARRGPFDAHAGRFRPQPRQEVGEHGQHEIRARPS